MHGLIGIQLGIRSFALVLLLGCGIALAAPAKAQDQSLPGGFTQEQVDGLEQIIRQYLIDNPGVVVEALTEFRRRQEVAEQQRVQQTIIENRAGLRDDPDSPILGNPDGDLVIVEFFDYRCPYCRQVSNDVKEVLAEDGNIRLVMKEWPILGPSSVLAARMALAVAKQGPDKYEAFHFALMSRQGDKSQADLDRVAEDLGHDVDQLKLDMEAPEIDEALERTMFLARTLGISGTPAFVIGDTLVPGLIDLDTMRTLIAETRANSS